MSIWCVFVFVCGLSVASRFLHGRPLGPSLCGVFPTFPVVRLVGSSSVGGGVVSMSWSGVSVYIKVLDVYWECVMLPVFCFLECVCMWAYLCVFSVSMLGVAIACC